METKMTVIVDNVAHGELAGEWGLSILVEYGFLSNKDELSICVDESYNEAFAEATANGIEAFFAG